MNNTGLAVFLDFSESINRLGLDVIMQRYGNLFEMYEEITDVFPGDVANEINGLVCSLSVSVTSLTTVLTVWVLLH